MVTKCGSGSDKNIYGSGTLPDRHIPRQKKITIATRINMQCHYENVTVRILPLRKIYKKSNNVNVTVQILSLKEIYKKSN